MAKENKKNANNHPQVYSAVRAIGILRPKLQAIPKERVFAESLDVIGTAFWLKEYRVLITCAHVVKDLLGAPVEITGLLVIGNKGKYIRARIDVLDYGHDLCILRLPDDTPKEILSKEFGDGLGIAESYPGVGKSVAYAGYPLGLQLLNSTHDPTYAEGVIGAQLRHQPLKEVIQITGPVVGGYSGAPIVLKDNPAKVIGVLSHTSSKDAGNANIFMAISWKHIQAIAELSKS